MANSTIRIAFLHASPTSTINPIWVKMLLSPPDRITPVIAESRVIGTIRITANGRLQLSYWAASTRKASSTQSGKTNSAVLPERICWKVRSVHSKVMPLGSSSLSSFSIACSA
ncbi:hypothetical protein D3C81_882850 [compost metagenome]